MKIVGTAGALRLSASREQVLRRRWSGGALGEGAAAGVSNCTSFAPVDNEGQGEAWSLDLPIRRVFREGQPEDLLELQEPEALMERLERDGPGIWTLVVEEPKDYFEVSSFELLPEIAQPPKILSSISAPPTPQGLDGEQPLPPPLTAVACAFGL